MKLASCLAQFASRGQRCLGFAPWYFGCSSAPRSSVISWANIDHNVENLVPSLPRWYANIYQPIEIPYQRN
jgi:hypothetical protein